MAYTWSGTEYIFSSCLTPCHICTNSRMFWDVISAYFFASPLTVSESLLTWLITEHFFFFFRNRAFGPCLLWRQCAPAGCQLPCRLGHYPVPHFFSVHCIYVLDWILSLLPRSFALVLAKRELRIIKITNHFPWTHCLCATRTIITTEQIIYV
jgi:hypothetical protein